MIVIHQWWERWKSLSRVRLFVTPWTVACQGPLFTEFSRQEYWGGLPFPSPRESSRPRDWTHISCVSGTGRPTPPQSQEGSRVGDEDSLIQRVDLGGIFPFSVTLDIGIFRRECTSKAGMITATCLLTSPRGTTGELESRWLLISGNLRCSEGRFLWRGHWSHGLVAKWPRAWNVGERRQGTRPCPVFTLQTLC